jgi:tetratricopeptide (TPR) repeat protein
MLKIQIGFSLIILVLILFSINNVVCQNQTISDKKASDAITLLNNGKWEESLKLLQENYEEAKKTGKEDSLLGNAINNLGEFYRRVNRLDESIKFFSQAIKIAEKISDKVLEGSAKNNLGLVLSTQKKYEEAILLLNQGLEIRKKIYGEDSPEVAVTLDNLGLTYADKSDFEKAEEFTRKALVIFEKKNGISHPDTMIATKNLADFYLAQSKVNEAADLYQRQIDLTEKEFGVDSGKIIVPIRRLVSIYTNKITDFPKQEVLLRKLLIVQDKNMVEVYPFKVYYSSLLGYALTKQKKDIEAENFFQAAVNGIDIEAAKKSPDATNIAISLYVAFLKDTGREKDALALEEKIRKLFSQ